MVPSLLTRSALVYCRREYQNMYTGVLQFTVLKKNLYEAHLVHQFRRACEVVKDAFIFSCYQDKSFTNCGRRVFKEQLQMTLDEEGETVNLYELNFP